MNTIQVSTARHFYKLLKTYFRFSLIGIVAALVYGTFSVSSIIGLVVSVPSLILIYWVVIGRVYTSIQIQSTDSTQTSNQSSTLSISTQQSFPTIDEFFDKLEHIAERSKVLLAQGKSVILTVFLLVHLLIDLIIVLLFVLSK